MFRHGMIHRYFSTAIKNNLIQFEKITVADSKNCVGLISFHQPQRMNALTQEMSKEFAQVCQSIREDSSVGAVVLTGSGDKAFSAGGDFDFLLSRTKETFYNNSKVMVEFYSSYLYPILHTLEVPVVSAINNHAVGAGFAISLASDIRIAKKDAKLGLNFVTLGLSPGMASTYFTPLVSNHQIASYLLLTGDLILASQAKEWGLVLETIDGTSQQVKERGIEIASKIAKNPSIAVKSTLRTLRAKQLEGLERSMLREADSQATCYATEDYKLKLEEKIKK